VRNDGVSKTNTLFCRGRWRKGHDDDALAVRRYAMCDWFRGAGRVICRTGDQCANVAKPERKSTTLTFVSSLREVPENPLGSLASRVIAMRMRLSSGQVHESWLAYSGWHR